MPHRHAVCVRARARRKRCVHLTNYSVNKKSSKFQAPTTAGEAPGGGGGGNSSAGGAGEEPADAAASKWSLQALRAHLEKERGPQAWPHVWRQVRAC